MTADVKSFLQNIEEFSLIWAISEIDHSEDNFHLDFQDVLTSLASICRQKQLAYSIEYQRPDHPNFRLHSDKHFEDDTRVCEIEFAEPGRNLQLNIECPVQELLNGLVEELRILGKLESNEAGETTREPELNLLVARTFQVELYSEYQRWKRYDTPFLVALAHLRNQDSNWKPVGLGFKHVTGTRDIVGYLGEGRVAAFFPSVTDVTEVKTDLSERLSSRFSSDELGLSFLEVPDDYDDWNSLKKRVFSPIYLTET